jgi:hypothetical protein
MHDPIVELLFRVKGEKTETKVTDTNDRDSSLLRCIGTVVFIQEFQRMCVIIDKWMRLDHMYKMFCNTYDPNYQKQRKPG